MNCLYLGLKSGALAVPLLGPNEAIHENYGILP